MSGFGVTVAVQASWSIDGNGLIWLDQPMHLQLDVPGLNNGVPPGYQGDIRNRLYPIQHGLEDFTGLRKANQLGNFAFRLYHAKPLLEVLSIIVQMIANCENFFQARWTKLVLQLHHSLKRLE